MSGTNDINTEEFDWVQLRKDVHQDEVSLKSKLFKKFQENPFVPIGKISIIIKLTNMRMLC